MDEKPPHLNIPPAELALVKRYEKCIGRDAIGLRDVLHILGREDMIELTRNFLNEYEQRD